MIVIRYSIIEQDCISNMAELINLDAQELAKSTTVTIKIAQLRQFRFRLWLAEKIIRLGMSLTWLNYEVIKQGVVENEMEWFGEQGLVISIAYGPMAGKGNRWSVDLLNDKTRETFDKPYVANSLSHCIEIARIEAEKRGWVDDR